MLQGKSTFHVKQGKGKFFSTAELKGYYNDLTNKVSADVMLDKNGIPKNTTIAGVETYFPITIFQYGLGLYDLYLEKNDEQLLDHFIKIANWAQQNIDNNGMWNCMGKLADQAHETQSAMCQGEGVSLLLRAYKATGNEGFHNTAKLALDFMLKDVNEGGTTLYRDNDIVFQEYVSKYNLSVLNGWIFAIFGLYDYALISNNAKYKKILNKTLDTLIEWLPKYDRKFWSNYDVVGTIASPAYHDVHIMQLNVLYEIFHRPELKLYAEKWQSYQKSRLRKGFAVCVKLKQKVFRSEYYDINTSLIK